MYKYRTAFTALALSSALIFAGCGGASDTASSNSSETSTSSSASATSGTVTVEDNHGSVEVTTPPSTVVSTDNRTFEVLQDWDVKLAAAPRALMPDTIEYKNDESITDIGNHREPDLEALAAANPDFILNGQRFTKYYEDIKTLNPDASIVELEPRDGEPLADELKRQVTTLGTIFGKESEAQQLNDDFDAAAERAKSAYNSEQKVMAVNVSGGEIGYVAPTEGRFFGPIFDLVGMTPALTVENASDNHEGDDISVEAIAESNPDWILVLDRDAAVKDDATPAKDVIENNEALKNVTAVKEGNIVYAPADTYTNESIQTYTEVLNSMADSFEGK